MISLRACQRLLVETSNFVQCRRSSYGLEDMGSMLQSDSGGIAQLDPHRRLMSWWCKDFPLFICLSFLWVKDTRFCKPHVRCLTLPTFPQSTYTSQNCETCPPLPIPNHIPGSFRFSLFYHSTVSVVSPRLWVFKIWNSSLWFLPIFGSGLFEFLALKGIFLLFF